MGRAPCCDKTKVKKGPWSPEEDATLKNYLENYGTGGNWIALPGKAGLKRCGKSCRLRWLNYLRPDIKHGGFTDEENNIIYTLYSKLGSRWSVIASHLQGRTDNDVKNHWNTKLKKKLMAAPEKTNHTSDEHVSATPSMSLVQPSEAYTTSLPSLDDSCYGLNMNTQNLVHPQAHYYPLLQELNTPQDSTSTVSGFSPATMDGNYSGESGFYVGSDGQDFVNGMWDDETIIGEFGYQYQSLGNTSSSLFSDVKPLGMYQTVGNQY